MVYESGAQNPNSLQNQRKAAKMYEQIRKRRTDFINVARNTNLSVEQCKIIKDYAFVNKHILKEGYMAFYPDFAMASSWFRLAEHNGNNIKRHDVIMLYHELYEIKLLIDNATMSQSEAHRQAEKKYNYAHACREYYSSLM